MSSENNQRLEETLRDLLDTHFKKSAEGIEPHVLAGAFLAFGIDRFGAVMGERHAAYILEQTAADLRARAKPLH